MKLKKNLFYIAIIILLGLFISACDEDIPEDLEFEGITFISETFEFDGQLKKIEVKGLPSGAGVTYENNEAIEVGVYNAKATITKEGYKSLVLSATLTIKESDIPGLSFGNKEYVYDGEEKEILVTGLPDGGTVEYQLNKGTNVGIYNAKATVNYQGKSKVLNATLTITPATITGVTFNSSTYTFDGEEKEIVVSGLPEGASVVYSNNKGTNAGTYKAVATVSKENYKDLVLMTDLVISKIEITNITFNGKTIEYDANEHSLHIVGNLPSGSVVKYFYNGVEKESVSDVGIYNVVARILESQNYLEKELTATLEIKSTEEQLYSVRLGNKIYFQNNLDKNRLYVFDNNSIDKVNNDTPEYLMSNNQKLYYYNKSLFSKNIMVYDGSQANSLISTKGEYLTTDGTYIYYAINNLLLNTSANGIYKIKLDGSSDPVKLTSDKASYLTYANNYIYYANNSESKHLYKVSVNSNNTKGTLLWEEKVEYIVLGDNNSLYFSSSKQIGGLVDIATAVYKFMLASESAVKLTTDAGKYLTVIGDYVYYVNNDKITSAIFGDGIYKVSILATTNQNAPGIKVLSAEEGNGFSSLTSDGTNLYYYKLNDKHFYKYLLDTSSEIDLMANYVPDNTVSLLGYVDIKEYKGEVFYINPQENGALYKYNPITKMKIKVLNDSVSNIYFHNDFMYYSTYVVTNYALFRMDLKTEEIVKISSDRTDNLIFVDDKIYYIKVGSLYNNYIYQMDLNGGNVTLIQNDDNLWVKNLEFKNDTFYYARNPKILGENISSYKIGDSKPIDFGIRARIVLLNGNNLIYYNHSNKLIGSVTTTNTNQSDLITNVEVNSMLINNGILYYSSFTSAKYGLYAFNLTSKTETKISDNVADALTFIDGKLYFIQTAIKYTNDYPSHSEVGANGELYYYNGTTVIKA